MVGRGLGGDGQALGARRPDQGDGAGGGQVLEVDAGTEAGGEAGQGDVAHHHELLGLGRHSGDAQPA